MTYKVSGIGAILGLKDTEMGICGGGALMRGGGRLRKAGMGVSKRHEWQWVSQDEGNGELRSANAPSTKETGMRLAYWSQ